MKARIYIGALVAALVVLAVSWTLHDPRPLLGLLIIGMALPLDSDRYRELIAWGILCGAGGPKNRPPIAKTANYTVVKDTDASGSVFTNRAAVGAVTFTLPAPLASLAGYYYDFIGVADQSFTVGAGGAGKGVAFNNAACASLACSTAGQKIGAHIRAQCDGTSWLLVGDSVGVTYTVA